MFSQPRNYVVSWPRQYGVLFGKQNSTDSNERERVWLEGGRSMRLRTKKLGDLVRSESISARRIVISINY